jgi:glyoxylase-like metal-dependent hydrolase (beta-lactamase superfamily II)
LINVALLGVQVFSVISAKRLFRNLGGKMIKIDTKPKKPKIDKLSDNLFLITLDPSLQGFENFIGVWLYQGDINFIVDVGPSITAPKLIKALEDLNVDHLDYILLTHIHIDHAGGIGEVANHFTETPIICHKTGIKHLVDPSRLWEGTIKTLGILGQGYGPITGVDENRFLDAETFKSNGIKTVLTPGHSAHHVSFLADDYLFSGEAGGVCFFVEPDYEYLRPATPPTFSMEIAVKSIDKLIAEGPNRICYSHFGMNNDAKGMLLRHKEQLYLWEKIIGDERESSPKKDFISDCLKLLLQNDGNLAGFFALNQYAQGRERGFLTNSIRGFAGYLENLANNF